MVALLAYFFSGLHAPNMLPYNKLHEMTCLLTLQSKDKYQVLENTIVNLYQNLTADILIEYRETLINTNSC